MRIPTMAGLFAVLACDREASPTRPDELAASAVAPSRPSSERRSDEGFGHLLLIVRMEGPGSFMVQEVRHVASRLQTSRAPGRNAPRGSWLVRAIGSGGEVLHETTAPDPRRIRGPDAEGKEVHVQRTGPVSFAIRVPVATASVELLALPVGATTDAALEPLGRMGVEALR